MASPAQWVAGARPKTLPAALAPVLVGTAAASLQGERHLGLALLALLVAVALQVGVNYANDYSDGIRGTDDVRSGPVRLVGGKLATPAAVRIAAVTALAVGCVAGLALVALSGQWWLLVAGALAVLAAWRYTGGSNPYGYRGLGEVYVFVFFGLLATLGTQFTQSGQISVFGIAGAIAIGSCASAILVANNLRDIPTDELSGKRTLAVRLGDQRTRSLYAVLLAIPFVALVPMALASTSALLGLFSAIPAVRLVQIVQRGARGPALIPVLGGTGVTEVGFAALVSMGPLFFLT